MTFQLKIEFIAKVKELGYIVIGKAENDNDGKFEMNNIAYNVKMSTGYDTIVYIQDYQKDAGPIKKGACLVLSLGKITDLANIPLVGDVIYGVSVRKPGQ